MAKATTKGTQQDATGGRHFIATLFATLVVGCCWAIPIGVAAKVNLDTVGQLGATWAAVGILTVVLGAICIHNALHEQGVAKKLLFAALALIFLAINFSNALANLSLHSETSRDTKRTAQETVATLKRQVSQVSQARTEQAAIAGNATPDAIEAETQAAKATDANRWNSTEHCNPERITAGPSRTFCANLAQLAAKLAAARKRDELDTKLAQLDGELKKTPAPESVDSFADTVAEMLTLAGYEVDAKVKKLISVLRDWARAGGLELIGEFGPSILLSLFAYLRQGRPEQVQKPAKSRAAAAPAKGVPAIPALPENTSEPNSASDDAEIDAFLATCVEFVAGSYVNATPLFACWQTWCEQHSIDPGTQMAFSKRIKRRITREANSGRPRYAGIALRTVDTPRLRVVSA